MHKICVVGAGYVGLVTGACLAELGNEVVCLEIDPIRLAALECGELPFYEIGLNSVIDRNRAAGRLRFRGDYRAAIPGSGFAFIAVPTPAQPTGEADTRFVFQAVRSLLPHADVGLNIVTKSTVPVGTGDAIEELAREAGNADLHVVSNPEFLREGTAVRDFFEPDRIVVGATTLAAGQAVASLYEALERPIVRCSRRSAEMAKYAANALLASRISFINEIAGICEVTDADVEDVARIVGLDRRIGPSFLKAGLGWGGSCFPKDVRALAAMAERNGGRSRMFEVLFEANARHRERAIDQLRSELGTLADTTIGILGLAFKPETDDVREAPALDIARRLIAAGARVRAHDPIAMPNAQRILPEIVYCETAYDAISGCDALILATEWPEYAALDWALVRDRMRGHTLLDGRNALDGISLTEHGFRYLSVGRVPRVNGNGNLARSAGGRTSP